MSVAALVAERAAETPTAPAIVAGERVVTYDELDTRANGIAAALREAGVGPEVVVGLRVDRSPEMVVGALAILKAGGAYLPIDPSDPPERQAFMLADAGCRASLSAGDVQLEGPRAFDPPRSGVTSDNLAYVIYTSGSTGSPKGVEVTHGALLNLVYWHRRAFHVSRTDRASQIAAVGFDACVWELWPYLTAGASVHLPDDAVRSDPVALRDWLGSRHITIAFVATPIAERLMTLPWPRPTALRALLTGADVLRARPSPELPFLVINNYGPTEATVVATSGPVPPDDGERPSIGRPIDNTQIHILDEEMRPVPIGAPGELCIGGAGLARGYRHRPELTAERFVANPFDATPEARLYKTGDRARYRPDGRIDFLGRIDDQVKIRGFRIEPNEIVAALDQLPEVAASAAIARDDDAGERILVGYIVPAAGARPTPARIRSVLATRLPEHMLPSLFVRLDALPLGPNGKLCRRALPDPDPDNILREEDFSAPRTEVERRVAALMAPLVGLERVGVDEHFFLLGGHSLLGAQLIARIRDVFGIQMSLRTLFDAPTVAKLSAEITRLLIERVSAMSEEAAEALLTESDHG